MLNNPSWNLLTNIALPNRPKVTFLGTPKCFGAKRK